MSSGCFEIRTDLAVEVREDLEKKGASLKGVSFSEKIKTEGMKVTKVTIETDSAAKYMKKSKGRYVTIENSDIEWDGEGQESMIKIIGDCIRDILSEAVRKSVLVVGLGNRQVTPDSLGPQTVDNLFVNNHFAEGKESRISALVPGVMAQTGIETAVLIKGVVDSVRPTAVIVLDALAARSILRLNTTVQLSDAGISPGAGVGNYRHSINKESLGVDVLAIGIPTVVDAVTIISDTMDKLNEAVVTGYEALNAGERRMLIQELLAPQWSDMFVTPKNVDETVKNMSITLAKAIEYALLGKG